MTTKNETYFGSAFGSYGGEEAGPKTPIPCTAINTNILVVAVAMLTGNANRDNRVLTFKQDNKLRYLTNGSIAKQRLVNRILINNLVIHNIDFFSDNLPYNSNISPV